MVLSALLIIAAAVWIAINFHKERSLIYPLAIPERVKSAARSIRSGLAGKTELISTKLKKLPASFKHKKKADNNSDDIVEAADKEEAPVDNSTETSDSDK